MYIYKIKRSTRFLVVWLLIFGSSSNFRQEPLKTYAGTDDQLLQSMRHPMSWDSYCAPSLAYSLFTVLSAWYTVHHCSGSGAGHDAGFLPVSQLKYSKYID